MRTFAVLLFVLCCSSFLCQGFPWPTPSISWWYAPDNNWPLMIDQVKNNTDVVTSVMLYCGPTVTDDGNVTTEIATTCLDPESGEGALASLSALGILPELVLNSGNCSIDAFRVLWSDTVYSIATMVQLAKETNVSGWNIDIEPQADNCQGGPTGTAEDAIVFAHWLSVLRGALNEIGVRLTVDVASWSPVISQYSTLSQGVDRMMTMSTYNANSYQEWLAIYDSYTHASNVPVYTLGVGLGCWVDSSTNGTWSVTPESAEQRVSAATSNNIPELAMFRLVPVTGSYPPSWPESFWWDALRNFTSSA